MCQGSLNGVSRKFPRRFSKFPECFKKGSRVFHNSGKGISRQIDGSFKGVFSEIHGYLKEFQREFQESFKGILRVFQGSFKGGPTKF